MTPDTFIGKRSEHARRRDQRFAVVFWCVVLGALAVWWAVQLSQKAPPYNPALNLRAAQAELIRARAECQADAVEFPDMRQLQRTCAAVVQAHADEVRAWDERVKAHAARQAAGR